MIHTVGDCIKQLEQYDPSMPVVMPDSLQGFPTKLTVKTVDSTVGEVVMITWA